MVHSPSFTLSRSRLAPNSFASLILLGASLSGVTSGCSTIRDITGLNVPEPQSKVSTGALTGAAVGGGLGLLVGSTGGNAGEGLLVGSLAGSAVGAGIGAAIGAIFGGGKGAAVGAGSGGAAGAGTVLATRGKPVVLPAETRLSFRLQDPVTIIERR